MATTTQGVGGRRKGNKVVDSDEEHTVKPGMKHIRTHHFELEMMMEWIMGTWLGGTMVGWSA